MKEALRRTYQRMYRAQALRVMSRRWTPWRWIVLHNIWMFLRLPTCMSLGRVMLGNAVGNRGSVCRLVWRNDLRVSPEP